MVLKKRAAYQGRPLFCSYFANMLFSFKSRRYERSGINMRVSRVPYMRPKATVKANGAHISDTRVSGIMPMVVVMVVRIIGRRRLSQALRIKSFGS